ncbi:hydrophobic surface binding protein A domain-containing protein [Trichoderma breve]|uniref:Hydrophobic surface binding protein A domain-containing protein n=1 Tax=Trichoderma breve TaxID=2034170 RepID=A0A9W9BKU7_9HYPO|nr:hydrophobic surface binding protein A domain-containing protein [Trichoderma breve]KAJ4861476.1 hydrophobic surface binding protein A domain-containing protein [Trichoderma breve]
MQFKSLLLATVLSLSHVQALTAKDVTNSISNITTLSADTLDLVKGLNTENVEADGLQAFKNFRQIVHDANETTTMIAASGNTTFAEDDQKDLCETFTGFVKTQQDLLQALVSQKGLLGPIPLSMPIGAILRFLETYVDRLSNSVIGLVPTCADESKKELEGLDKNFNETLDTYPIKLHLPEVNGTSLEAFFEAYLP